MFLPNDLGSFSMRIFKKVGWLKCISNIGLGLGKGCNSAISKGKKFNIGRELTETA